MKSTCQTILESFGTRELVGKELGRTDLARDEVSCAELKGSRGVLWEHTGVVVSSGIFACLLLYGFAFAVLTRL
jgi:hypothetical protein